jgi:hypothetical protein
VKPTRFLAVAAALIIASAFVQAGSSQQSSSPTPASTASAPTSSRAMLDRYCVSCHNEKLQTAGLALDTINVDHVDDGNRAALEKVIRKLRAGVMPPAGRPRPEKAVQDAFIARTEAVLDDAATRAPNPGRPAVHRLNRAEYANAIRDLLAVEIDTAQLLPVDDSSYGFDNIADVLSVSPTLLERYLTAAEKITRVAIGDPAITPVDEVYNVSTHRAQDLRISEDLPFGSRGGIVVRHHFPVDGEYQLHVKLKRHEDQCCSAVVGLDEEHQLDVRLDGERVASFALGGPSAGAARLADEGLVARFPAKAGTRLVGVTFVRRSAALPDGVGPERLPQRSFGANRREYAHAQPRVHQVSIGGPFNIAGVGDTPSRRRIFVCTPASPQDEEACARRILSTLARRAFRRPVTSADTDKLLAFYTSARQQRGFEAGIELALRRLLVDPEFLFRIEQDPLNARGGTAYRISDLALASRLAFFLWSSIPDDELLDVASRGQLKDPAVLERQVRRMLADARSSALITNFMGQWLHLRNLRIVAPDVRVFPDFEEDLREAFRRETELFVDSVLREDRSVLDLLTANYSYLNERLARHYQVPGVTGGHFRRVTFSEDSVRGGLIGQGSILTVTSYPNRTSPVTRGKWLLENIIGMPPPAPPPNVPDLPERTAEAKPVSMRERMEKHRANPVCAGCHRSMDPLGFALENFDGIGRWRAADGGTAIDASGAFPDGTAFNGPLELRRLLRSRGDEFVSTLTEKLLTYALGRGLEAYDMPTVRRIVREAEPVEYRWSALVLGIVRSLPFQMRMPMDSPRGNGGGVAAKESGR